MSQIYLPYVIMVRIDTWNYVIMVVEVIHSNTPIEEVGEQLASYIVKLIRELDCRVIIRELFNKNYLFGYYYFRME